ncbi:MAG: DNA repair exonuclease [Clostridiales bacterium]|nr:DNA repair exonuclease [Clostridiales bacterium]
MKIIHTADLHLDSKIDGIPTEKSKIRRDEIIRTFERLVDFAKENDVKAIIIAGDMFDTQKVSLKTRERVFGCIRNNKDIDFLYAPGNHDQTSVISTILDLPTNFIEFNDNLKSIRYGDIVVSGILLNSTNKNIVYDVLSLNEKDTNIVIMHGQVAGYKSKEDAEVISIPRLKGKFIDYLALGHIHSYSAEPIDERGYYVYSGCLDGRGFDELGSKGFVLLDCEQGKVKSQFIEFSSRTLFEKTFDASEYDSFYQLSQDIIAKLQAEIDARSLVKVILKGQHSIDFLIDTFSLASRLNEIFFFAKVYDKTELKISLEDYRYDKSIKGEFVRSVWESDMTIEQKNKVIKCGLSALKGEEF